LQARSKRRRPAPKAGKLRTQEEPVEHTCHQFLGQWVFPVSESTVVQHTGESLIEGAAPYPMRFGTYKNIGNVMPVLGTGPKLQSPPSLATNRRQAQPGLRTDRAVRSRRRAGELKNTYPSSSTTQEWGQQPGPSRARQLGEQTAMAATGAGLSHVHRVAGRYVFLFAVLLSGLPPGAGRADGWDPTSVVDNSRLIYGICASRSIATGIHTTAATVGVASSFTIQVHFATLKDHGLVSPDPNK